MNVMLIITLAAAVVVSGAGAIIFATMIVGIHGEERYANLAAQPRNHAERLARRAVHLHVSRPDLLRILNGRIDEETPIG